MRVVDAFCGVGGVSCGVLQLDGVRVVMPVSIMLMMKASSEARTPSWCGKRFIFARAAHRQTDSRGAHSLGGAQ